MPRQAKHDPGVLGARPECKHGNVFVGLYGEQLAVICQCSPSPADVNTHAQLREKGWFQDIPKQGEAHGEYRIRD